MNYYYYYSCIDSLTWFVLQILQHCSLYFLQVVQSELSSVQSQHSWQIVETLRSASLSLLSRASTDENSGKQRQHKSYHGEATMVWLPW